MDKKRTCAGALYGCCHGNTIEWTMLCLFRPTWRGGEPTHSPVPFICLFACLRDAVSSRSKGGAVLPANNRLGATSTRSSHKCQPESLLSCWVCWRVYECEKRERGSKKEHVDTITGAAPLKTSLETQFFFTYLRNCNMSSTEFKERNKTEPCLET